MVKKQGNSYANINSASPTLNLQIRLLRSSNINIKKDQLTQKFNWDNFHLVTYLSEGETSQRIEEFRQLLNEIYIEPEPEITENEMSQRMNEMSQRMDELKQMLSQIRPDDPEK